MTSLSDRAVDHLRGILEHPESAGGRYEIGELLGRGGMGSVYCARDTVLGREVALKVLNLAAHEEHFDARLRREAQVLARLEHPGIVPVYDAGTLGDGRVFYVMRLVRGQRLDEYAAAHPGRGALMRHFLRVCEAVAFAHAHGVIHRDLKPGNIMIGPLGEALVLDWGVAKLLASAPEDVDAGAVVGTPGFMAPEQAMGQGASVDERSDVYGLGSILRQLLRSTDGEVPRALLSIVSRATAPDPNDRYRSSLELADDVRRWIDGEAVRAHDETAAERIARLFRRHQTAVLLLVGYALVRLVLLLWRGI